MLIEIECISCKTVHTVEVTEEEWIRRQGGMAVQDAFPNMSPAVREMFISGLCPECWNKCFKGMENE